MKEYTSGYAMTYEKKCIGIKLMKRTCRFQTKISRNASLESRNVLRLSSIFLAKLLSGNNSIRFLLVLNGFL